MIEYDTGKRFTMDVKFFEFRILDSCVQHTCTRATVRLSMIVKIYSENIYRLPSYRRDREIFFHRNSSQLAVSRAISRFLNIIRNGNKVVSGTSFQFRRASFRCIWWESLITTFPIGENMVMKTEKRRISRPEIVISAYTTETIVITDDIMKIAVAVDSPR